MNNDMKLPRNPINGDILLKQFDGAYYSPSLDGYFSYEKDLDAFIPKFIPDSTKEAAHMTKIGDKYYLVGNNTNRKFPIVDKKVMIPDIEYDRNLSRIDKFDIDKYTRLNMSQKEIDEKIDKQINNDKNLIPKKNDRLNYSISDVLKKIKKQAKDIKNVNTEISFKNEERNVFMTLLENDIMYQMSDDKEKYKKNFTLLYNFFNHMQIKKMSGIGDEELDKFERKIIKLYSMNKFVSSEDLKELEERYSSSIDYDILKQLRHMQNNSVNRKL